MKNTEDCSGDLREIVGRLDFAFSVKTDMIFNKRAGRRKKRAGRRKKGHIDQQKGKGVIESRAGAAPDVCAYREHCCRTFPFRSYCP